MDHHCSATQQEARQAAEQGARKYMNKLSGFDLVERARALQSR
jgi:hypothetical protein